MRRQISNTQQGVASSGVIIADLSWRCQNLVTELKYEFSIILNNTRVADILSLKNS